MHHSRRLLFWFTLLALSCSKAPKPEAAFGAEWPREVMKPVVTALPPAPMRESGRLALLYANGETKLLLADEDAKALVLLDSATGQELAKQRLECAPEQLVTAMNGDVFVAQPRCNRVSRHRVSLTDEKFDVRQIDSLPVAVEPVALALTPDEATLLVVSAWGRALTSLSLPALDARSELRLPREPRAVSTTDDGQRIFVSHASGSVLSEVDFREQRVTEHSLASRVVSRVPGFAKWHDVFFEFDAGFPHRHHHHHRRPFMRAVASQLHATQGFALVARERRVLIPEALSNPGELGQVAHGYGVTGSPLPPTLQDVAVFDLGTNRANHAGSFSIIDGWSHREKNVCRLPRAAAYDDARDTLLVACLGSDRILEVDALARDPGRTEVRQFNVARGPVAIAIEPVGRRAFVWSRFARVVSVLDLGDGAPLQRVPENSLGGLEKRGRPTPTGELLTQFNIALPSADSDTAAYLTGMALFQTSDDPRLSRDGRACESCHPAGRDDGLAWRTGDQLAARQTPMLDGRVRDTAPYGWLGQHATLEQHLENTVKNRLQGTGLSERELGALAFYVRSLPGPPNTVRPLAAAAERGKALFHRSDMACSDCHEDGDGVDGIQYAIAGTTATDTPSLRFVSGAGPYFHDGRYADLDALLRGTQGTMGQHAVLTAPDRADLVAFLESL